MSEPAGPVATATPRRRLRVRIEGTVQGVGFRPYVFRLVDELGLGGFVGNDERGVVLEVEGSPQATGRFLARLPEEAPALASIDRLLEEALPAVGETAFRIVPSARGGIAGALVTPDATTCNDCLRELFDPADRRYRYPFVNCTDCGPRFTIVRGVPYDRPLTTMAGFPMCPACRAEYEDPRDRRFHAQPNACPECGPRLRLGGSGPTGEEALRAALDALAAGRIVAVKGLGGFHLACRADLEAPARELRARKRREARPFALMVRDLEAARKLVELGDEEASLLTSRERPIVLAPRRRGAPVAEAVAPGRRELGVMLPYTPLHHLLLVPSSGIAVPLVMTSGNPSGEPIAHRDGDAVDRLACVADLFLLHDRPIESRCDDSVVRVVEVAGERRTLPLRRSRGFVPAPLELPVAAPGASPGPAWGGDGDGDGHRRRAGNRGGRGPGSGGPAGHKGGGGLLTVGGHQKNAFCIARGRRAWMSQHVGDLDTWEARRFLREGVEHLRRLFSVEPDVVAHDLHPEYASTSLAAELAEATDARRVSVQHHHAHLAAVLAEHGETGPAVGAIYDGTGYGPDGTVWGGELLVGDLAGFERAGHLRPMRLPGGEAAVREPWRMACAWLVALAEEEERKTRGTEAAEGRGEESGDGGQESGGRGADAPAPPRPLLRLLESEAREAATTGGRRSGSTGRREGRAADSTAARSRTAGRGPDAARAPEPWKAIDRWRAVARMAATGTASPVTTSMGRLFDAVAALCGVRAVASYEGQAAVELEALADPEETGAYPVGVAAAGEGCGRSVREVVVLLDPAPALRALLDDLRQGVPVPAVSARFHRGTAHATAEACARIAAERGLATAVLSGGVFQNRLLLEQTAAGVAERGLRPLVPTRLPPNDGGLAFGQAAVAAARMAVDGDPPASEDRRATGRSLSERRHGRG